MQNLFISEDGMEDLKTCRSPLGVPPHDLWIDLRKVDLARAIHEYIDAKMTPPIEWIDELRGLIKNGKVNV